MEEPLAFISHTDEEKPLSIKLVEKLKHRDINLNSFCYPIDIHPGNNLNEKIICNIVNTDILICIIDSDAAVSEWMKWEYTFCKERNLTTILIIFPSQWEDFKQNKISFLDSTEIAMKYDDDYNTGVLLDKFFIAIKQHRIELIKRYNDKSKIIISLDSIKDTYCNTDSITIKGKVKSTGLDSPKFNLSRIYLYKHSTSKIISIDCIANSIDLDSKGKFSYDFSLSEINGIKKRQKLYFEVRFDNKSEIISTTYVSDNDTSDTLPQETSTLSDSFEQRIKSTSRGTFLSISKNIQDHTIDRTQELSKLVEDIKKHDKVVITGNKGLGKSVILCNLYDQLKESDDILFIRCDDYLHIQNISELETIIFQDKSIYEIIQRNYNSNNKLLIFFDSLDAISRNSHIFEIFKQFLKQLWGTGKIKTVCSVRSYDFQYSYSISSTDWGKEFTLNELSDKQLNDALDYLNRPNISSKLLPVLKNPLNLKLFSLILKKSNTNDLRSITTDIDLYDEHWKEYVVKSDDPTNLEKALFLICKEMIEKHRTSVIIPNSCSQTALTMALSRHLLKKDPNTNTVQFFHHAYLDYVISRYLLENFENLDEFIIEQKYNIFLRPTIIFTFSILEIRNQKLFLNNVKNILSNNEIQYYWKLSVLHVFSNFKTNDPSKIKAFGQLFNKNIILRQHFLQKSTKSKNPFWFESWIDSFIQTWANESHTYNRSLLEYLKSILLKVDHSKLFNLLQIIVEKNDDNWTKKIAVEIASTLNVEKSDWYLKLSNHSNSYVRLGVIESFQNLIECKAKNLNKIFSNIFLFKETSNNPTTLSSGASLVLKSNTIQDNMGVIWAAGEYFSNFLEKNPHESLLSIKTIIEDKQKDYPQNGMVIEDYGYIWYEFDAVNLSDEGKLLSDIKNFLKNCTELKLKELIPILTQSSSATLHKIAITVMLDKMDFFKDEIISELLINDIYKIKTLENTIKFAIKQIFSLLTKSQLEAILNSIMEISLSKNQQDKEKTQKYLGLLQAKFLSVIPTEKLSLEQKKLLEQYPQQKAKENFDYPVKIKPEPIKKTPEDIIDLYLEQNLDHEKKIKLLISINNYLNVENKEFNITKFPAFKDFLLIEMLNKDPNSNSEDSGLDFMDHYDTIRGLVSRCLIKLYYHTKDKDLVEPIKKLSEDPINVVRAEIAYDSRYLYSVNPSLTLKIITKYSQDSDYRVQFFLTDIVSVLTYKHPQKTINIIKNIIQVNISSSRHLFQFYVDSIVYLSLIKQNPAAKSLLNKLIMNIELYDEFRKSLPFVLKSYLSNESTQDDALKIFYTLLDSKDHVIREKTTFFLLSTLNDKKTFEIEKFIDKIKSHLDKIAMEIERKDWNIRIIEHLIKFLEENWIYIPKKSIEYLQRISNQKEKYLTFNSWIADGVIIILNGLFHDVRLSNKNKQSCLDILDKFAMSGWPKAFELLASMERPD